MKKIVIEVKKYTEGHYNGSINSKETFKMGQHIYKIAIHSECYSFQSYAKLLRWSDANGFQALVSKSPSKDYDTHLTAYKRGWEKIAEKTFKPIYDDLTNLAKKYETI